MVVKSIWSRIVYGFALKDVNKPNANGKKLKIKYG